MHYLQENNEPDIDVWIKTGLPLIMIVLFFIITMCSYYARDKNKQKAEEMESKKINKILQNKENDWWNESGGPLVTNEGQVASETHVPIEIIGSFDTSPVKSQYNRKIHSHKKSFMRAFSSTGQAIKN